MHAWFKSNILPRLETSLFQLELIIKLHMHSLSEVLEISFLFFFFLAKATTIRLVNVAYTELSAYWPAV